MGSPTCSPSSSRTQDPQVQGLPHTQPIVRDRRSPLRPHEGGGVEEEQSQEEERQQEQEVPRLAQGGVFSPHFPPDLLYTEDPAFGEQVGVPYREGGPATPQPPPAQPQHVLLAPRRPARSGPPPGPSALKEAPSTIPPIRKEGIGAPGAPKGPPPAPWPGDPSAPGPSRASTLPGGPTVLSQGPTVLGGGGGPTALAGKGGPQRMPRKVN